VPLGKLNDPNGPKVNGGEDAERKNGQGGEGEGRERGRRQRRRTLLMQNNLTNHNGQIRKSGGRRDVVSAGGPAAVPELAG
ncbi:hypothetical protein ScalyP_jg951, partial [Parmales sp. scaly parma]